MARRLSMAMAGASLLGLALIASVAAQTQTSFEERFFRIDWQIERAEGRRPAIVGIVTNHYFYPVERVRLQAHVLDQAGQLTHETFGVISDVPAGGRSSFRLDLPAAGARYIVIVHSFEFGAAQSP